MHGILESGRGRVDRGNEKQANKSYEGRIITTVSTGNLLF